MRLNIAPCISLLLLTTVVVTSRAQEIAPYPPECRSWDDLIDQLPASVTCEKIDQCSGVTCSATEWGSTINLRIKLFPCDEPPQMRLLITGLGNDLEETVTHGSTYNVPGLSVSPLPFVTVDVEMVVQFEPQENDNGEVDAVILGVELRAKDFPSLSVPLFEDVRIQTPPCTVPPNSCDDFGALVDSVPSPNSCSVKSSCDGLDCTGRYHLQLPGGLPGGLGNIEIEVDKGLTVDSCAEPISFIVTTKSPELNLDWTHTFNESDTVPVDQPLRYGAKLLVSVAMTPLPDLENILSTINYTLTAPTGIFQETLLDNDRVPIPECRKEPTNPTTPPPEDDSECTSWTEIENSLEFNIGTQYGVQDCVTLPECTGFNCTAIYESLPYILLIEEFHCAEPPYILVTIDGPGEHYTQKFTHNETVPLHSAPSVNLTVHLVSETQTSIYIGVYVDIGGPSGPVRIPLVEDQMLEVSECGGTTTTTTAKITTIPTTKVGSTKKEAGVKDSSNAAKQSAVGDGGISMLWTIILAVFAAIVIGIVFIAVFLLIKRRNRSLDSTFLMESRASISNEYENQVYAT